VDPYAVLQVGNVEHKSRTIKKNYDPEWHEDFVFQIQDSHKELVLTLYDWDKLTQDDVIGSIRVKVIRLGAVSIAGFKVGRARNVFLTHGLHTHSLMIFWGKRSTHQTSPSCPSAHRQHLSRATTNKRRL